MFKMINDHSTIPTQDIYPIFLSLLLKAFFIIMILVNGVVVMCIFVYFILAPYMPIFN